MKKILAILLATIMVLMTVCSCSKEKCDVCNKKSAKHIVEAITTWNLCDDCYEMYKSM